MSAIETTRIMQGTPAYYCRSAPGDFVVVSHRGTELFLSRHRWLALPELEVTAVSAADPGMGRGRGALRIAALFLVFTILQAAETTLVLIGMLFKKMRRTGVASVSAVARDTARPAGDNASMKDARPVGIVKRR